MNSTEKTGKPGISEEGRKTLHLNGLDFENFETPPAPIDHAKDKEYQEKFNVDGFYGSQRGLKKMIQADKETKKFNDLTLEARIAPEVNHGRSNPDSTQ